MFDLDENGDPQMIMWTLGRVGKSGSVDDKALIKIENARVFDGKLLIIKS